MPRTKSTSAAKVKTENQDTASAPKAQEENKDKSLEYDIHIFPNNKANETIKALVNINISGQFAVRGIKIVEGVKGLFVSMPSYRIGTGEYKDICFPCTKESRADFDSKVIAAYKQTMEQNQNKAHQQDSTEQQQGTQDKIENDSQPAMLGM